MGVSKTPTRADAIGPPSAKGRGGLRPPLESSLLSQHPRKEPGFRVMVVVNDREFLDRNRYAAVRTFVKNLDYARTHMDSCTGIRYTVYGIRYTVYRILPSLPGEGWA